MVMAMDSEAMRLMVDRMVAKAAALRGKLDTFRDPIIRREMSRIVDDYEKMAEQLTRLVEIQERWGR
jgi:dephospho-CoA kinase